jgi:hypothetical protein
MKGELDTGRRHPIVLWLTSHAESEYFGAFAP